MPLITAPVRELSVLDLDSMTEIPNYLNKVDPAERFDFARLNNRRFERYQKGRFYVFLTCPDLNLTTWERRNNAKIYTGIDTTEADDAQARAALRSNVENFPLIKLVSQRYPDIINSLTLPSPGNAARSYFIPFFTNMAEGFPASDESSDPITYTENFTGLRMQSAKSSLESSLAGTFTLEIDELKNMFGSYLVKVWMYYITQVLRGQMFPRIRNIYYRRFDYMSSMYCFAVSEDGKTIQYFSKYTGIWPISAGFSAFEERLGTSEIPKLAITFAYQRREELVPEIFRDFNAVASGNISYMTNPTGEGDFRASSHRELRLPSGNAAVTPSETTTMARDYGIDRDVVAFLSPRRGEGFRNVRVTQKRAVEAETYRYDRTWNRNRYILEFYQGRRS